MCLSPTMGVVRSAQFATCRASDSCMLIGHIGRVVVSSSSSPSPSTMGEATSEGMVKRPSASDGDDGERLVVAKGFISTGLAIGVVDGSGRVVQKVSEPRVSNEVDHQVCNTRWIVLTVGMEVTMWKLGSGGDGTPLLPIGESSTTFSVKKEVLGVALYENDPDVLLMVVLRPSDGSCFLLHIDLKESFIQREIVLKKEVPLPKDISMFRLTEGIEQGDDLQVFCSGDLSKPFLSVPCPREIPGVADGSQMHFIGTHPSRIAGGVIVWGSRQRQKPESYRYAITDAATDTLLAFLHF
ncbi:hypothetical protein Pelo_17671 [Pelomyxa schiedti]|nr:hypothetical protein Pelo_17671 [Pelomyxa schiedti]